MARELSAGIAVAGVLLIGCARGVERSDWGGEIDTLPGGTVLVRNPATGAWRGGAGWVVVEELRIGADDGEGPEVLGDLALLVEDAAGRVWALERRDQQFKVFDREGRFVRAVGRAGGGPGELRQAIGAALSPTGEIVVVDPQARRVSWFDSAGTFLRSHAAGGGFVIMPWPGGLGRDGALYDVVARQEDGRFGFGLVRYDTAMTAGDTLRPPRWDGQAYFEHQTGGGSLRATVPYTSSLQWLLTPDGDFWALRTGSYELFRLSARGDTLRKVTRGFDPLPVSAEEKDAAVAGLSWFTNQGGTIDRSRIPDRKPAARGFFLAADGYLWVTPTVADSAAQARTFDVFDPEGRFLGPVVLPFPLAEYPRPLFQGDRIIGVTHDATGVPYLVRARVVR